MTTTPPRQFGVQPGAPVQAQLFRRTVEAARYGDRTAFAVLFARRAAPVAAYIAEATRDRLAMRLVTRQVFMRAWRELPGLAVSALVGFDAWLLEIADAEIAAALRGRAPGSGVHGLPLRHRQTLALRTLFALSTAEVARCLQATPEAVAEWEQRALETLAEARAAGLGERLAS